MDDSLSRGLAKSWLRQSAAATASARNQAIDGMLDLARQILSTGRVNEKRIRRRLDATHRSLQSHSTFFHVVRHSGRNAESLIAIGACGVTSPTGFSGIEIDAIAAFVTKRGMAFAHQDFGIRLTTHVLARILRRTTSNTEIDTAPDTMNAAQAAYQEICRYAAVLANMPRDDGAPAIIPFMGGALVGEWRKLKDDGSTAYRFRCNSQDEQATTTFLGETSEGTVTHLDLRSFIDRRRLDTSQIEAIEEIETLTAAAGSIDDHIFRRLAATAHGQDIEAPGLERVARIAQSYVDAATDQNFADRIEERIERDEVDTMKYRIKLHAPKGVHYRVLPSTRAPIGIGPQAADRG